MKSMVMNFFVRIFFSSFWKIIESAIALILSFILVLEKENSILGMYAIIVIIFVICVGNLFKFFVIRSTEKTKELMAQFKKEIKEEFEKKKYSEKK